MQRQIMTNTLTPSLPAAPCGTPKNTLSRRDVLGALAALPAAFHASSQAQDTGPIKIAQSTALTGPLVDLGLPSHQGAQAYLAALNAKGGVNGRQI